MAITSSRQTAARTPVHDANGEIVFYHLPIRGAGVEGFADITLFTGFGGQYSMESGRPEGAARWSHFLRPSITASLPT